MSDPSDQMKRMELDRSQPKHSYKFWETQPVDQFDNAARNGQANSGSAASSSAAEDGAIHEPKTIADVRQEPYPLNAQFEWCLCDLSNEDHLTEVFNLLRLNYVEDDDAMFRFCYSRQFLRWALCPPGHKKDWHLGVRVKDSGKLVRLPQFWPIRRRAATSAPTVIGGGALR